MNIPAQGLTRIIRKGFETARGPGPDVMAASTLEGDKVLSIDGDDVGKIKEIMLDVISGRIAYAVLSSGGMLGIGDKLVAIPWSAFTLDAERKCLLLSESSEQIRNAPGFDKDHWPATADPKWAGPMHESYGSAPYWRESDQLDLDEPPHAASPNHPESGEERR
ncbi:PRC-barrel domain containing protein [Burkholderia sp. Bp8963]|uniref:PRC-barrel domain-containing protein n=1 Tax=Burkholderia sp. Bp8963 TaxID=2184547 RepID=UPI000F5AA82B|nr:PRC-barrel domain-containing protein [Burkholderia sp. Bp8963]RQS62509.1 PRC-barrel domain containing protein [Burkholderia sp. Bp8963]